MTRPGPWKQPGPVLTLWLDRGPDNMALVAFLKYHVGLRLHAGWDPIHEQINVMNRGLQAAGWWSSVLDLLLAWKLPWGPWLSLGFWRKLQQAAKAAKSFEPTACNLLQWLKTELQKEVRTSEQLDLDDVWNTQGTKSEPK